MSKNDINEAVEKLKYVKTDKFLEESSVNILKSFENKIKNECTKKLKEAFIAGFLLNNQDFNSIPNKHSDLVVKEKTKDIIGQLDIKLKNEYKKFILGKLWHQKILRNEPFFKKELYFDINKSKLESDLRCFCGKYEGVRYKGIICDKCGTELQKTETMRNKIRMIDSIFQGVIGKGKERGYVYEDDILKTFDIENLTDILEYLYETLELEKVEIKK